MMNKRQFIDKMLVRFMSNASETTAKLIADDYERLIPSTLDFDYLYDKVCLEYQQRTIPQIAQLKQWFKTAEEYAHSETSTQYTWKIFAKTKKGYPYEFHCFLNVPEMQGVAEFKKARPELIYVGNNYREVMQYGY